MNTDNLVIGIIADHPLEGFGIKTFLNKCMFHSEITILNNEPHLPVNLKMKDYDVILICTNQRAAMNKKFFNLFTGDSKPALVILSGIEDIRDCIMYMGWGAKGYIGKQARQEHIVEAIEEAVKGSSRCTVRINCLPVHSDDIRIKLLGEKGDTRYSSVLSAREFEIARRLADGERTKSIAESLHLKESTVSTFKKNIFVKLDISNVVELHNILIEEQRQNKD